MGTLGRKVALLGRSSSEEQDQERAATIVTRYLRQRRLPKARKLLTYQAAGALIGQAGYSGGLTVESSRVRSMKNRKIHTSLHSKARLSYMYIRTYTRFSNYFLPTTYSHTAC